jgi:hypothetical protein
MGVLQMGRLLFFSNLEIHALAYMRRLLLSGINFTFVLKKHFPAKPTFEPPTAAQKMTWHTK